MAEFKLGRIRFVWKGDWSPSQTYYKDDVVKFGGRTYICQLGHVSESNFNTDLNYSPAKWNLLTDGKEWRGDWDVSTQYEIRDVVKYGGNLYICKIGHESANTFDLGLEEDQLNWDIYAEGFEWKNDWQVSTRYKVNDVVKYGGSTFICQEHHTSASTITLGLEDDQSKWNNFTTGFEFKGIWQSNGPSFKYKINDVVKQGSALWICVINHDSSSDFLNDSTLYWNIFVEGIQFEGDWNLSTVYQPGDIVLYGGNQYVSKTNHVGQVPTSSAANWDLFTRGFKFTADWNPITEYRVGDVVRLRGFTYLAKIDNTGNEPPNLTFWDRLNSGIQWQNEWQDDVEYKLGDIVRFGSNSYICILGHLSEEDDGSSLGGAADSRPDQDITGTYWNLLSIGSETSVLTNKGDLVYFGGTGPTRLPIGKEGQVLVAKDDIPEWETLGEVDQVYFVAETGIDLPAPTHGKTLNRPWKTIRYACEQVENGALYPNARYLLELNRVFIQREVTKWIQFQISNNIAPFTSAFVYDDFKCERDVGFIIDRLIHDLGRGGNLKIRAAAQTFLNVLEDGPFSNQQDGNGTGPYGNLAIEADKSVAAYNYMLEVISAVLSNQEPGVNYQIATGDSSTAVVNQYIDFSIEAEDVNDRVQELVGIIITALDTQDPSTIPARFVPTTLIQVATGKYRETLPIIVPAYTCVKGDELRSTNTGPAGSLIDISDSFYTISTFDHVNEVVQDIITGANVVTTTGNNVMQSQEWPYAEQDEKELVRKLVEVMKNQSDYRLGTMHSAYLTDPVDYNTSYLQEYGNARKLIKENKKFLQEEVVEFLEINFSKIKFTGSISGTVLTVTNIEEGTLYPNLLLRNSSIIEGTTIVNQLTGSTGGTGTYTVSEEQTVQSLDIRGDTRYGRTKTRRDVGYIIDALIYDLTYDGNALSVQAGLAYFDGDDDTIPQIPASIKTATIESLEFLKSRMMSISRDIAVTPLQTRIAQFRSTAGSIAARDFIENNVDDIIDIIDNGPQAVGTTVTLVDPTPADGVNSTTALISAYTALDTAIPAIQEAVIDFINSNFGDFTYNGSFCRRDAGLLVDAGYYDAAFGSNFWAVQNGISFFRPQSSKVLSDQLTQKIGSVLFIKSQAATLLDSNSTAVSRANDTYDEIVDILRNGVSSADAIVYTDPGVDPNALIARQNLVNNRQVIIDEGIAWINSNFPALVYDEQLCRRDIGYTVDALAYDAQYGGNLATKNVMRSLFNQITGVSVAYPTANERTAGIAFYTQLGVITGNIVRATGGYSGQNTSAGDAGATFDTLMGTLNGYISTAIDNDDNDIDGIIADSAPVVTWVNAGIQTAVGNLASNRTAVVKATLQYITTTYNSFKYDHAKAERDAAIVLKAVGFDFMFNSNYQTVKAAWAYLRESVSGIYSSKLLKDATLASLDFARTQAIANVAGDTDAIARINNLMITVGDIIFGGSNEGDVCQSETRNIDYAILQLEKNKSFIVAEIEAYIAETFSDTATATSSTGNLITISDTSWLKRNVAIKFVGNDFGNIESDTVYYVQDVVSSTEFKISTTRHSNTAVTLIDDTGSMSVELVYNKNLCLRDVETYVDALKWDLRYSSNYKSRFVARYYANAVLGSKEEDMYYLRDGTGLRDQTTEGLSGDLTPRNMFGTSRVTAGAYASLDPGWGPADFRTWILTRSPYVQNLTTFGHAAIGQKIDGDLHAGGNDSIVSNDFTQVISDGIGAWVANNGRAELVSVFTYYSHIGYLSTEGGRIRGTNGNNSYGDFGSVAEGFDDRETPGSAVVDNIFQFRATIGSVYTNGSAMLNFEFENAGKDYTEVEYNLLGGGISARVEADEFRDSGVFQVRLLETAPEGEDGEFGGRDYLTSASTAQGGTSTTLTLAAVDDQSSTAYPGMRIFLTGGAGAGQFGLIDTYNNGTKVATILKEVDDVVAGNFQTSVKYRIITVGTTDFTLIGAANNNPGTIFTASGSGTGNGVALELASGWDHIVAGTSIASPDASTTYVIEPAITFSSPAYSSSLVTGPAEDSYAVLHYAEQFQTFTGISGTTSGTGDDAEFNVIKKGLKYLVFLADGGSGYERLDTVTILGSTLGGTDTTNDIIITITSVNSVTGAIQAFDQTGLGNGGNFISLVSTTSDEATVFSNEAWSTESLPTSEDWKAIATGRLKITVPANELIAGEAYTIDTIGDTIWTAIGARNNFVGETFVASGPTSGSGLAIPVKNISVAVAHSGGTNDSAYSEDGGLTWTAGGDDTPLPAADWTGIAYGDGVWVAISTGSNLTAYTEDGGITWVAGGNLPSSTTWSSITYGAGTFVAVASGGTQAAYSTDGGVSWTAGTLPSSSNWNSVAFGNNRFVAVSSTTGTVAAYSLNGINWTASTLPASAAWTKIAYGQGVFLAVSGSTQAATSADGVLWRSRAISTSNSTGVAFGNPSRNGQFLTISSTGTSNVSKVLAGARAKGRAAVAETKIFEVRLLEPGSRYVTAPTMIISDPNKLFEAPFTVRIGDGALANPSFVNRGSQYVTGNAEVRSGNGFADNFQSGSFVAVRRISSRPVPGSNVVFEHLPMRTFKLVNVFTFLGEFDGSFTAFYQVSPPLTISEAPDHLEDLNTRLLYSQVRLTGHDFLEIGTGNFEDTNYPGGIPENDLNPLRETVENNGGRVFFTSTDQDGNFRVGDLFAIEQSTGIATLNADAFNISGLQELNLGNVTLGGGSATITEFSTDPFFTADSDNVIPTQRAIKAYIAGQIGGGGASLNVNSVTAGSIFIGGTQITTVTGAPIRINATFNFSGGVTGIPLALNYFL